MLRSSRRALPLALAVVLGLLVAGVAPASAAPAAPAALAARTVDRVGGADVYSVAIAASKLANPVDGTGITAVVTSGTSFLTGVVAGAAAANLDGQLLLTAPTALGAATAAELERLAPQRIIVVGNSTVVNAAVETRLRAIQPNLVRIGAADLYATSILLAQFADASSVVIAGGATSPATLSAAVLAGSQGAPLVLVRPSDTAVRADLSGLFTTAGTSRVTVIGESAAVSASFANAVTKRGIAVTRVRGTSYAKLSAAIAARFSAPGRAFVMSNTGYALAVGSIPLAAASGAPVIYSTAHCASPQLIAFASAAPVARITLLGPVTKLHNAVGTLLACQSLTKASSYWVVANKKNKLNPVSYVPADLRLPAVKRTGSHLLRKAAATSLEKMNAGSVAAGAGRVGLASGYRSYPTQKALYARYVRTMGQKWADSQSARAGHSEHQTGLAADVVACSASACGSIYTFADSKQGTWVKANAWRYGFIVRYEKGYTNVTGYASEPWHLRYIGAAAAADYKQGGFHTLETYFAYRAAPGY
ncbi:D-alanyl-D-alanine carboxypeptidase family protein [Glaciihabitans arcticus]|nr:D-alanyl-D-alanine carboxypeptidase family protein [Glaciihabitans arcticus]